MAQVLVVCTANQCRSPMGEAFLRTRLERLNADWTVSSAGLMPAGSPVVDEVQQVMTEIYGIDMTDHRSLRISPLLIDEVDLVLGMERLHVREVALQDRSAFKRAFTVKEFLRRSADQPPQPGQKASEYFVQLAEGRSAKDLMGASEADDIGDPMGRGREVFDASAAELADDMGQIAQTLAELA